MSDNHIKTIFQVHGGKSTQSRAEVGKKPGGANITRKLFPANWYRGKKPEKEPQQEHYIINIPAGVCTFSLNELEIATDYFADRNIILRDDSDDCNYFSKSYKGRLKDGLLVAVKLYRHLREHFKTGVETMSIANVHPNLLRLIGVCVTQLESMLVYPYMANGSVASRLRDRSESQPPLDWQVRKQIALGAARGLAYLHDGCERKIIHRNVKAANIYLNEDFEAIIGNFELAIHMDHGLITGQRAYDRARFDNYEDGILLDWVKTYVNYEKKWERIVDPDIGGNNYYVEEEVEQLIRIALRCTQNKPERRPDMSEIVRIMLPHGDGLSLAQRWEEFCDEEIIPDSPRQSDELSSPR
ncbi:hypothetical protein MIMGU_mgv11b021095mg [Erythranthe guttata]|uniref:non-specific serine/threonine protein kinase n=1 Tax=Erythranthe guttata TaxID=4155 RepID=A0A022RPY6_ERYGU|nr:hypothetical protein MIMGU_mgv11b021095mg [Erythranthe guttata]